jgi:uncharacterized repeat protein (TIGR01451 family)
MMKTNHTLHFLIIAIGLFGGRLMGQVPGYMPAQDSLVAWWPFNGNSNDESGNGHNGITTGAVPAFDRAGNPNAAYFFNGVEDIIQVAHHNDLNSFPITYSWWMKPQTDDDGGQVFRKYANATWNGYNIAYWPSPAPDAQWEVAYRAGFHIGVYQTYGNPYDWANDPGMFDNNWHHYVFVVDSLEGTFYKDGNVIATYPWYYESGGNTPFAVTGPWELTIGSGVRGMLDDLVIWKTALSIQEVSDLYSASSSSCQARIRVYNDLNANCASDDQQLGLPGQLVTVEPGGYGFLTDITGHVFLCDLPDGDYVATIDTANSGWFTSCPTSQAISIVNGEMSTVEFALTSDNPCAIPNVTITSPTIRRCSEHTWPIYVFICNDYTATGNFTDGYVLVELDENIIVDAATSPSFTMVNGLYRFEVPTVNPGDCITLVINANFSCDLELNETLCIEATLYPVPECTEIEGPGPGECTEPWDHSSLSVEGECDEETGLITFTIENGGEAMVCPSEVRVYVDGELYATYYIQLGAESDTTFTFPSNGGTWILQADQHPLHPGSSRPNDHVEGCGDIEGEGDGDDDDDDGDSDDDDEWQPGLVDDIPSGDESPFVDTYCGQVVGSFDPNDKQGFPGGIGEQHEILPNEQLQYLIRFQNTGTAPAYTVIIRDTLDTDLDITSVTPGVASHPYTFTMFGQRVLQWTFNNIMLPDSFSNEEQSHGFITYSVNQMSDLSDGTQITNSAAIYFDSNEPIITNITLHTINHCVFTVINPSVTDLGNGTLAAAPVGQIYQWVNCATGDAVAGASSNTLSGEDGLYAVQVTSANACTEESACFELVGINELNASAIRVFPVPASQVLTAVWTGEKSDFTITSPDGRVVSTGSFNSGTNFIDISLLSTGNYFIKANNLVTRFVVR